jgi:ketol-acid reductoisomerase
MDVFYERDADLELIRRRRVGLVGYGSQGRTHALNLRDSGVRELRVALKSDSASRERAISDGFEPVLSSEVARWADVLVMAAPDEVQPRLYAEEIAPHLRAGSTLVFIHGLAINFGLIRPSAELDVVLVNPKGAGAVIRSIFERGGGVFGLLAVHQDASGRAWETALAYGAALGCGRAGMMRTTFRDECECDLFGEQAVLCGGIPELIRAAWETLVEAGYPEEAAWFETLHEAKLVTDLVFRHGIAGMHRRVSNTVGEEARAAMRQALAAVRDGSFVARLMADQAQGQPELRALRGNGAGHPIEAVDARLHEVMKSSAD